MSKATGITRTRREANYLNQEALGTKSEYGNPWFFSPKQNRRIKHKENRRIQSPENPTPRRPRRGGMIQVCKKCGQYGPYDTNPCLTKNGKPARKPHNGRIL